MVTNLVEGAKEKCTQYWPEQGSMEVGPFTVTITDQHKLADYTIRTFILQVGGVSGCGVGVGSFTVIITDQHKLVYYTIRIFILQVGGLVGVVLGWGHSLSLSQTNISWSTTRYYYRWVD